MKSAERISVSASSSSSCASTRTYICAALAAALPVSAALMPTIAGGGAVRRSECMRSTCFEILRSWSGSLASRMIKRRSKRESSESGSPMFCIGVRLVSYWPYTGLAAATTEQRALSDAWIPAFEIVTVCCSITSWIATRSASSILSNSSTQHTPRSASTIAPASSLRSPVSSSVVTAAVRPTPEEPLPVVDTASGAMRSTKRRSCDLAVEGSPSSRTLMSPRRWVPFLRFFSWPPSSMSSSAVFSKVWPQMEGASDLVIMSTMSSRFEKALMFSTSSRVKASLASSFVHGRTWLATTMVLNMPLELVLDGSARWMPATCTRSPGLQPSTRSLSRRMSTERGSWPGGARSGISWSDTCWWSMYSLKPYSV
mmetsp:Transcript_54291/g.161199  ORF Transcript_54291/g.161199 Transcript_54291/m.161199 type:complete len:370 (-) Transcript_54291:499-1608(-)